MEKKDWNAVYKQLSQNWDRMEKLKEKTKKKKKKDYRGFPVWGYGPGFADHYGDLGATGDFGSGGDGGGDGGDGGGGE